MFGLSMAAMVFYTATVLCLKMATKTTGYVGITVIAMLSGMVVSLAVIGFKGEDKWAVSGIALAALAGVFGTLGNFFEVKALNFGSASTVRALVETVPLALLVIEFLVLRSVEIRAMHILGVVLSVSGVVILSRS